MKAKKRTRPIEDKILEQGFMITKLLYDIKENTFVVEFKDPDRGDGDEV